MVIFILTSGWTLRCLWTSRYLWNLAVSYYRHGWAGDIWGWLVFLSIKTADQGPQLEPFLWVEIEKNQSLWKSHTVSLGGRNPFQTLGKKMIPVKVWDFFQTLLRIFLEFETWDETFPTWVNGWFFFRNLRIPYINLLFHPLWNMLDEEIRPHLILGEVALEETSDISKPPGEKLRMSVGGGIVWILIEVLRESWKQPSCCLMSNLVRKRVVLSLEKFWELVKRWKRGKTIQRSWRIFFVQKTSGVLEWWYSCTNCWKLNMIQWWFAKLVHLLFHVGTCSGSMSVLGGVPPKDS